MAIYEYRCEACGAFFEVLVRPGERTVCPHCGGGRLRRQLSTPALRSSGTRDLAMRAARKRDAGQASDRMHDRLAYEKSHDRHG